MRIVIGTGCRCRCYCNSNLFTYLFILLYIWYCFRSFFGLIVNRVCVHMFFFVCSFSYYILFCRHRNRRLPYTILHNKFSEENRRKEKGIERSTISWMIIMIQSLIRQFSHFDSCYISFYRFATKFIIASLCISFSFHFISLVMFGLLLIIFKHASDTNPQQQKPLTIQNKFTLWKISLSRETKNKTRNSTRSHIAKGKSEVGIILQYEKLWKKQTIFSVHRKACSRDGEIIFVIMRVFPSEIHSTWMRTENDAPQNGTHLSFPECEI